MERAPDAAGHHCRLAGADFRVLERCRLTEHEQRELIAIDPGVIADRLDVLQDDHRIRAVAIEAP
jgi:hypothetical protein